MIWKIIFLLACFKVLIKAGLFSSKTNQPVLEEEYLEEKYSEDILISLNSMPTLAETDVTFDDNDVKLLSGDCYPDNECLNKKNASIEKYHQKMQAIQCIHGLFVLDVLDDLNGLREITRKSLNGGLQKLASKHRNYLKSMLSLLNMANWDAYAWQIEIFTFVEGLAAPDAILSKYIEHSNERMREKVLEFVRLCVHNKYLLYPYRSTSVESTITGLAKGVHSQMKLLYKSVELDLARRISLCTVRNLMLQHLYNREYSIFSWSMYPYKLVTRNIKLQFESYVSYIREHMFELDPISGNKYNALILKCVHLRLVHFVWFHLHAYHTLKKRTSDVNVPFQIWNTLVKNLKNALRMFGFDENIYWSALHLMMVDLNTISIEVLETREKYTRNYFCKAAENLGLANVSDIDRQLKEVEVSEDFMTMSVSIEANAEMLSSYITHIIRLLEPVDITFIPIIVSAEGNDYFYMH